MAALSDDVLDPADTPLCVFWLGGRCLGIDLALVGELVTLQGTVPVPMAHEALRGVFNLRGAPMVVLDLAEILQLGDRGSERGKIGLVLRVRDIVAAGEIERMEAVIPAGRGEYLPRDPSGDHPAVLGFLDDREVSGHVITVLDPAVLIQRLEALRYVVDRGD